MKSHTAFKCDLKIGHAAHTSFNFGFYVWTEVFSTYNFWLHIALININTKNYKVFIVGSLQTRSWKIKKSLKLHIYFFIFCFHFLLMMAYMVIIHFHFCWNSFLTKKKNENCLHDHIITKVFRRKSWWCKKINPSEFRTYRYQVN